ncbi:MAG: hypothetical protein ACREOZ_04805, partial [Gloeomargaritales cyanobacterium]
MRVPSSLFKRRPPSRPKKYFKRRGERCKPIPPALRFLPKCVCVYPMTYLIVLTKTTVFFVLGNRLTAFGPAVQASHPELDPTSGYLMEPPDPGVSFTHLTQELSCAKLPVMEIAALGVCIHHLATNLNKTRNERRLYPQDVVQYTSIPSYNDVEDMDNFFTLQSSKQRRSIPDFVEEQSA